MEIAQRIHIGLLRRRTAIRNHKTTLKWMRLCWRAAPHDDPDVLSSDEYDLMFGTLLYAMTICWEDEMNDLVLDKMWRRDASSFNNLDYDRFCCAIFRFVEMWVQDVTQASYEHVFKSIHAILRDNDTTSSAFRLNFKPALESINNQLDQEKRMDDLNINLGKSVLFNVKEHLRLYGVPVGLLETSITRSAQNDIHNQQARSPERQFDTHRSYEQPTARTYIQARSPNRELGDRDFRLSAPLIREPAVTTNIRHLSVAGQPAFHSKR